MPIITTETSSTYKLHAFEFWIATFSNTSHALDILLLEIFPNQILINANRKTGCTQTLCSWNPVTCPVKMIVLYFSSKLIQTIQAMRLRLPSWHTFQAYNQFQRYITQMSLNECCPLPLSQNSTLGLQFKHQFVRTTAQTWIGCKQDGFISRFYINTF